MPVPSRRFPAGVAPRSPLRAVLTLIALTASLLSVACEAAEASVEEFLPLEPIGESRAPYSGNNRIAVTSEGVACVIDSYQIRVFCVDRRGVRTGYFGREGNGPGEFAGPSWIARGPSGAVAVGDMERGRMLLFQTTGVFLSETRVPQIFVPSGPVGSSLLGMGRRSGRMEHIEIDVASGDIKWNREYPDSEELTDPACDADAAGRLRFGHPAPDRGMMLLACRGQFLVWFADRDDDAPAEWSNVPTYQETFPSQTEVDRYVRGATRLGGGITPPDSYVEEFRNRSRNWHVPPIRLDARGRAWIATRREDETFSYIDVHRRTEYLGTVRVRDSLIQIDIAGSIMVVLVDRPLSRSDPNGIPQRGIDWYDISGVEFRSSHGRDW